MTLTYIQFFTGIWRTSGGWVCLSIKYQVSENMWKTPAKSSRKCSDQWGRRAQITISYTSVSFTELSKLWGCSRQLAHASEQWGWSKTWHQIFVWVDEELSKPVIPSYYFMIYTSEELTHELTSTEPLCQRPAMAALAQSHQLSTHDSSPDETEGLIQKLKRLAHGWQ